MNHAFFAGSGKRLAACLSLACALLVGFSAATMAEPTAANTGLSELKLPAYFKNVSLRKREPPRWLLQPLTGAASDADGNRSFSLSPGEYRLSFSDNSAVGTINLRFVASGNEVLRVHRTSATSIDKIVYWVSAATDGSPALDMERTLRWCEDSRRKDFDPQLADAAIAACQRGIEAGRHEASLTMALNYREGNHVEQDAGKAEAMFEAALAGGEPLVQLLLASMLSQKKLPQQRERAIQLLKDAAAKGQGGAYTQLAYEMLVPLSGPPDYVSAEKYALEAFKLQDLDGAALLVSLNTFEQDSNKYVTAYAWHLLISKLFAEKSSFIERDIGRIKPVLSAEQLEKAGTMAVALEQKWSSHFLGRVCIDPRDIAGNPDRGQFSIKVNNLPELAIAGDGLQCVGPLAAGSEKHRVWLNVDGEMKYAGSIDMVSADAPEQCFRYNKSTDEYLLRSCHDLARH